MNAAKRLQIIEDLMFEVAFMLDSIDVTANLDGPEYKIVPDQIKKITKSFHAYSYHLLGLFNRAKNRDYQWFHQHLYQAYMAGYFAAKER